MTGAYRSLSASFTPTCKSMAAAAHLPKPLLRISGAIEIEPKARKVIDATDEQRIVGSGTCNVWSKGWADVGGEGRADAWGEGRADVWGKEWADVGGRGQADAWGEG